MPDIPDYELPDSVQADTSDQIKAISEPTRSHILDLVLERAATVSELAIAIGRPKSSVAYHVDALVKVGMLRVVRTRRVRAIEERFYGRTGRTIIIGNEVMPKETMARNFLVEAVNEARPGAEMLSTIRHARINEEDAAAFFDQVAALAEDFTRLPRSGEAVRGFVAAVYATDKPILAEPDGGPASDGGSR